MPDLIFADISASPMRDLHIAAGVLEFSPQQGGASLPRTLERMALGGLVDGGSLLPAKVGPGLQPGRLPPLHRGSFCPDWQSGQLPWLKLLSLHRLKLEA